MCVECPVRICGLKKQIDNCGKCKDYPCKTIEDYVPSESVQRQKLEETCLEQCK